MGSYGSASIVVGEMIERHTHVKNVTKYNEDTGEPYIKEEPFEVWKFKDGTILEGFDECYESDTGVEPEGHYVDYGADTKFYGYFLVGTSSYDSKLPAEYFDEDKIKALKQKYKEITKREARPIVFTSY